MKQEYLSLDKLEVYKLARKLSHIAWDIYQRLGWQDRKIMGDQFVESTDSVAANIAEGFGRFHFLDKVKFYFNARGSLLESRHWLDLLSERKKINSEIKNDFLSCYKNIRLALNGLISSCKKLKEMSLIT